MMVFEKIKELLDTSHTPYLLSIHEPVRTSQEAAHIRGTDLKTGAKAMVIKATGQYYLFVLPAYKKLDWKKVKHILAVKDVRLATEEEAEHITGVKVGGVPPFGNILGLPTYYDTEISTMDEVNFNAGLKTHSINMKAKDLVKLVRPIIHSFSTEL